MRDYAFEAAIEAEMLKLKNLVSEYGYEIGWKIYSSQSNPQTLELASDQTPSIGG